MAVSRKRRKRIFGRSTRTPELALAHFNLADLLLQTGRPAQAVPLYRAGLALEPANAQAQENLRRAEGL